jgi:hypothetical protein
VLDLLAAWGLFSAALLVISLGCGLLLDRLSGISLPGPLLPPAGLALVFVVSRLVTEFESTTGLTLPLLLLLAAAGFALGRGRLRIRPDGWAIAAAVGVFAVAGAPVFLSGEPTLAGSIVLPDTGNQLTLAAFTHEHGHHWQPLELSSYRSTLSKYLVTAYPVAAQSSLGALSPLGGVDLAWLYQPFLTFALGMLALSLYALLAPVIQARSARALAAFVAAQPALLVSYALQGSIKEVTGASMLAASAALGMAAVQGRRSARALVPFAVAVAAGLGVLGVPAAAYLTPIVLAVLLVWGVRILRARSPKQLFGAGAVLLGGAILALPVLTTAEQAFRISDKVLTHANDLGNLAGPLQPRQFAGIWFKGDYRVPPLGFANGADWALVGLIALVVLVGAAWLIRRRAFGPLLFCASLGLVSIPLLLRGNPYADGKVLAVASPAVLAAAAAGVWALRGAARGLPAGAVALVLGGGVLYSNALAYHDVKLAPHDRYQELIDIDKRLAGQGPALLSEYDEFGGYLLRRTPGRVEPELFHIWRTPYLTTSPKRRPNIKAAHDVDHLQLEYLESFKILILRRSPVTSRPPANYRREWRGRYYEIWRRQVPPRVIDHLPLGNGLLQPDAIPRCGDVRRLAAHAGRIGARLAYVARPRLIELLPIRAQVRPAVWGAYGAWPGAVVPVGPGELKQRLRFPAGGRYVVWLEGSFGRAMKVWVDRRYVGDVAYEEGYPGGHQRAGEISLAPGVHDVRVVGGGGDLRPGNGGSDVSMRHLGPVVFSPRGNERRELRFLDPASGGELCGRTLDWIEVVRRG